VLDRLGRGGRSQNTGSIETSSGGGESRTKSGSIDSVSFIKLWTSYI
jgi:hypothetical protein